ncbi:hypothetical protein RUM44_011101 [Polyplax serrata]|uniref:Uncharacterized protein n=1 Tax=Polyplax serrata TaxID=468196 RepID=A0ABR1APQ9_POLSC
MKDERAVQKVAEPGSPRGETRKRRGTRLAGTGAFDSPEVGSRRGRWERGSRRSIFNENDGIEANVFVFDLSQKAGPERGPCRGICWAWGISANLVRSRVPVNVPECVP